MKRWVVFFMVLSLFAGIAVAQESVSVTSPAANVAESWLKLVDGGQYAESWGTAGAYFQKSVTEEAWASMVKRVREPLGTVISRTYVSETPMTSLPGAPDGDYILVRFETSMTKKEIAAETVTVVKEADGAWRVAGYLIA